MRVYVYACCVRARAFGSVGVLGVLGVLEALEVLGRWWCLCSRRHSPYLAAHAAIRASGTFSELHAWEVHGRCARNKWEMRETCMDNEWAMSGQCVCNACAMRGKCADNAWTMRGQCVGSACAFAMRV